MGSRRKKMGVRPSHIAAGVLMLAVPGSAVALAATTPAPAAPAPSIESISLGSTHVGFGKPLSVTGRAVPAAAGQPVELQLETVATDGWRIVDRSVIGRHGQFHLGASMHRSGDVRVTGVTTSSQSDDPGVRTVPAPAPAPVPLAPSIARRVTVGAELDVAARSYGVLAGQTVTIAGHLRPGVRGRRIVLQARHDGRWRDLASSRTSGRGHFRLRYRSGGVGHQRLRIRFLGDAANTAVTTSAGGLTVFEPTVVSWYEDAGNTACGFHAHYGVANLSLPCGTHVTFRSGNRTVTATVDDRGPYVGGRTYDLNQNTAGALGFAGVGTIWASA
jgi:hypothetical protein